MTNEEAIYYFQTQIKNMNDLIERGSPEAYFDEAIEASHKAIKALELLQQFLEAGYEGKKVEFYIGGRKFAVREIAQ